MKTRGLGPNSRPYRFKDLDRRTAEGRAFERFRKQLLEHVGGKPDVVQRAMIERAAWVQLRLWLMDRKLANSAMTSDDSATYLAWANTLRRLLVSIGDSAEVEQPGAALQRHLASLGIQQAGAD